MIFLASKLFAALWLFQCLLCDVQVVVAFAPAPTDARRQRQNANPIIHGVIVNSLLSPKTTALYAKKKGSGAAATKATSKIQVKLLKHVAGTGQAGDVVMVTPAFFNNKLRPTKSAQMISDEEVARELSEAEQQEKESIAIATALQEKLSEWTLTMTRKAGPDGQLFGGINTKMIITEMQEKMSEEKDFLGQKFVKITEIIDGDGKKMRGDIKHTGTFACKISLRKDVVAKFNILVEAEN